MFIYAIRARTIKLFALVIFVLALIGCVVALGGGGTVIASASAGEVDYSGIKTNEDRVKFIESFGIKVEAEPIEEEAFAMPENFDRVILGYNELQKKQGLDLSKYSKKRVTRYTYRVTNYGSEGEVYANLFVWRGRIIGCDVSSADPEGFVAPLTLVDKANLK
ncbi:MAG: DUF4830 domain-containing protein [Clostridia bacterium]|nr:DUF4830 domain-containing protein [Clostridia bacterium]